MSRDKIEEMRKEVAKAHRFFLEDDDYESLDDYIADELYNAGYRKQKEGEWLEIDDGVLIGDGKHLECSECGVWKKDKQRSNFCSHCGARMKGGAE